MKAFMPNRPMSYRPILKILNPEPMLFRSLVYSSKPVLKVRSKFEHNTYEGCVRNQP